MLSTDEAPADCQRLVAESVDRLGVRIDADPFAGVEPRRLSAAAGHRVFGLTIDDVAEGRGLEATRLVAWKFLVVEGMKALAAVELGCDPGGVVRGFSGIESGPIVEGTRAAIVYVERTRLVREGDYVLRALRVPPLPVLSLWLVDLAGKDDRIVLVHPRPQQGALGDEITLVEAPIAAPRHRSLKPDAFFDLIRPAANRMRAGAAREGPIALA